MFSQTAIKSRLFANLAQFCAGGTSYPLVISHLQRSPDADVREWASWLAPKAHCGAEASLMWRPDLFSPLDRAIVFSGENSGHLSEAFQYLSQYYIFMTRVGGQLCRGLLTPAFLLLGGTIILAVIQAVIAGGTHSFWMHFGPPIFALGLGVAGIFLLARWGIQEAAKNVQADRFLRHLPLLGKVWQGLTESRFALSLSLHIQAGMPLITSLEFSGNASRSAVVQQGARRAIASIKKRPSSLSEIFQKQRFWSPLLLNAFHSEESSKGTKLFQAARTLQQSSMNQMEHLCNQIPKAISIAVALLLFWKVFALFSTLNMHYTALLEQF